MSMFTEIESAFGPDPVIEQIALRRAQYDALAGRYPLFGRQLADSRDRVGWAKARSQGIGASDAAAYAKIESAALYQRSKEYNPFGGNSYTAHGNDREPVILAKAHLEQNFTLFHSAGNRRHMATPDGIKLLPDGSIVLAEVKTVLAKPDRAPFTNAKGQFSLPPAYARQMWWAQYVCGADATLFLFEEHDGGMPTEAEPGEFWFVRDDEQIEKLIIIADLVLAGMDSAAKFDREMRDE